MIGIDFEWGLLVGGVIMAASYEYAWGNWYTFFAYLLAIAVIRLIRD